MMTLIILWAVMAAFCTACMWNRGYKWWQTTTIFLFCYSGLVAATIALAIITTL
jgi:hypothetical protein